MATQIKSVNGGTGVRMADGLDLEILDTGCNLMDIDTYMVFSKRMGRNWKTLKRED